MKRLILFFVMCAFAFVAQAQVRKFHYVDGGYWVKVDLNKKEFLPDGCGVDPMPIKNYKKVVMPPVSSESSSAVSLSTKANPAI